MIFSYKLQTEKAQLGQVAQPSALNIFVPQWGHLSAFG